MMQGFDLFMLMLPVWLLMITPASPLASPGVPRHRPIKRVGIIGTGIAGLAVAHALVNSPALTERYSTKPRRRERDDDDDDDGDDNGKKGGSSSLPGIEVDLFDSRPVLDYKAGAGMQLNGGMSVLRKMNPTLQRSVADAALPLKNIRSRTKPWFNNDSPFQTLFEMNVEDVIREAGGKTEKELIVDGEVMCYAILRGTLQEVLMKNLPPYTAKRVNLGKSLTGIRANSEPEGGILCDFSDGVTAGPFDLVVGCDGIKSAVKEHIETGKISEDSTKREGQSSIYSGLRIKFCVQDGDPSSPPVSAAEFRQYFGDGAYGLGATFGTGAGRPAAKGAYVAFYDEGYNGPFKKKEKEGVSPVSENADWNQDIRIVGDARGECLQMVRKTSVPDVEIGPIIENSNRFFELGVYFHNPFTLNGWSKQVKNSGGRYCVLAGDAAHAMPPFLGQGANQAIQDAYCLATKVFANNANVAETISTTVSSLDNEERTRDLKGLLRDYERQRWYPTTNITLKAAFLGYLEAGSGLFSKFRDVFFFTMGKLGIARRVFLDAATPKV